MDGAWAILTTQESKSVRYILNETSSALPQDCLSVVKCRLTRAFLLATAAFRSVYFGFSKLKDIKGKENTRHLLHAGLFVAEPSMVFESLVRNSKKRLLLLDHTRLAILLLCVCSIEDFPLVAM